MKFKLGIACLFVMLTFFSCKKEKYEKLGLQSVNDFGSNPGKLAMYYYEPENASYGMPLLVVLHGCSQDAAAIAELSEWNKLADRYGFYVLYPEQKTRNNATKCFNWFKEDTQEKDSGENKSIRNMISHLQADKNLDANRTFITGVSAGAAMSMVMLSCYPNLFQAGAILSGEPYKAAENATESVKAMAGKISKSPAEWGDLVRKANPAYTGEYPKLLLFHGKDDNVVDIKNAEEIVKQWTNVLNISGNASAENEITEDVRQYIYQNSNGDSLLIYYEISDMGHKLATDPGSSIQQGGGTGTAAKDKDFYSSYWAAHFFGLLE